MGMHLLRGREISVVRPSDGRWEHCDSYCPAMLDWLINRTWALEIIQEPLIGQALDFDDLSAVRQPSLTFADLDQD